MDPPNTGNQLNNKRTADETMEDHLTNLKKNTQPKINARRPNAC